MVLVVVAIWIHRSAAAGCSHAHAGVCLRDGPDDIRVAPERDWSIEVRGFLDDSAHSGSPVVLSGVHLEAALLAVVV